MNNLLALIFGIFLTVRFSNLSLSESISILFFIYSLFAKKDAQTIVSVRFSRIGLFFVTTPIILLSDLVNRTPLAEAAKGIGAFIVFPILIWFIVCNFSANGIWLILISYVMASALTNQYLFEAAESIQSAYKFGLAIPVLLGILSIELMINKLIKLPTAKLLIAVANTILIACLSIWGDLRQLTLISVLTLIPFFPIRSRMCNITINRYSLSSRTNELAPSLEVAILLPFLVLGVSIFFSLLSNQFIGLSELIGLQQQTLQKTISQSAGALGVLFGGRPEIFGAVAAWLDHPFLGWGSWAIDRGWHYYNIAYETYFKLGYTSDFINSLSMDSNELYLLYQTKRFIPTHSLLLNALVWYGLFGFIPIYTWLVIYIRRFLTLSIENVSLLRYHVTLYIFLFSIWNVLFSPFGYSNRSLLAIMCAFVIRSCNQTSKYSHRLT